LSSDISCQRAGAATGISEREFIRSTEKHIEEVINAGHMLLGNRHLFQGWFSEPEWSILEKYLSDYLQLHDKPKVWDRAQLELWGYPDALPPIRLFLSDYYGVSFSSLDSKHLAHQVKDQLNSLELRLKRNWMQDKGIEESQFLLLERIEYVIDVIVTKLSPERKIELNFVDVRYSASLWILNHRPPTLASFHYDQFKYVMSFESFYRHSLTSNQYLNTWIGHLNLYDKLLDLLKRREILRTCRSALGGLP
ncbi:MAG: hypothetical protein KDD35_06130, partial [Bdellovibrionales bacterium]|nr:hypothetical protein [Bdellovibrionales bacterium]